MSPISLSCSPSSLSFEDTHNTLKYADRAKNIKSSLVKNVISVNLHVSRYAKIVEELKAEVCDGEFDLSQLPEITERHNYCICLPLQQPTYPTLFQTV